MRAAATVAPTANAPENNWWGVDATWRRGQASLLIFDAILRYLLLRDMRRTDLAIVQPEYFVCNTSLIHKLYFAFIWFLFLCLFIAVFFLCALVAFVSNNRFV